MTRKCLYAAIIVFLALMTACSGSIKGVVREDAKRVPFEYSNSSAGSADLQVAMPDGERFEGRLQRGTKNTEPESARTSSMDRFEAVESFDGNADAVLSGNRGNIMKCRFRLTDFIIGLSGGGVGICQVSDGRVIDIFF